MRKYANEMIMKTSDKLHDIRNRASLIAENELVVKNLLSFRTDSRSIIHNSRKTINRDSPIVAKYGKIEKLQQSIENHLSQLTETIFTLQKQIADTCTYMESMVLIKYFFESKTIAEIASILNYSESAIRKMKKSALSKISDLVDIHSTNKYNINWQ